MLNKYYNTLFLFVDFYGHYILVYKSLQTTTQHSPKVENMKASGGGTAEQIENTSICFN